jgi:SAM-dependent methyltransferase
MFQVAVADSSSRSTPALDTKRTADMIVSLLAKGEAHLANNQFADALDCFDLALCLDPQNHHAQLGRNRAYCQIVPRWHFVMLNDHQRNTAFDQALRNTVTPETVVLDIGSGTGLLAMMAIRAGAKQAFTCEMVPAIAELARETVELNGMADRIVILEDKSTSLVIGNQMPRKANLLVTETVDSSLLAEDIVSSIMHAKANLLTDDAQIIPCAATVYAMVLESPTLRNLNCARTVAGFDVSLINRYATAHYVPARLAHFDYTPLTEPFEVFNFDFVNGEIVPEQKTISVRATRDGMGQCIAFWFNMQLDAQTSISNEPGSTVHWDQALQCLDTEVAIRAGDTLAITVEHDNRIILFNNCEPANQ